MKKHVLIMMAVCLLAIPTMAKDLADQLCADEVFILMVTETGQVVKHAQSLSSSEREV